MKNKDNFLLENLKIEKKGETVVLKGAAAVANKVHAHAFTMDGTNSFRSYFTNKALEKMNQDLKYRPIFIDALHSISTKLNNDWIIENILAKYPELNTELNAIKLNLQVSDIPMFKLSDFELKDNELIVTVESNPLYKEVDESHRKAYEVITESIHNGAINGFSIDFVSKEVTKENGIDKIDDLDLMGISLVHAPALGSNTCIAEVATRSIKRLVETRIGEKMTENEKENNLQVNVEEIVNKKVEEALKARELEALKQRQEQETLQLKKELEELKAKALAQQNTPDLGSKGTPKVEKSGMSYDELKARVKDLSDSEAIRLYAEFVTNNDTQRAPPLVKTATHKGDPRDPRITWNFEPSEMSMAEMHRKMIRMKDSDRIF